jgi:ubiquinone biosynthesis monooxygenase Coq7
LNQTQPTLAKKNHEIRSYFCSFVAWLQQSVTGWLVTIHQVEFARERQRNKGNVLGVDGRKLLAMDKLLNTLDSALRTLFAPPRAAQACPAPIEPCGELSAADKAHAGALMRVNHVGEVCAQALYTAQALATKNEALRTHFQNASADESNHLAWTKQRLDELGARPSLLNPLWYAGAFGLGLLAGRLGDKVSLGFVLETEAQVEAHLQSHLGRLPAGDTASRTIVAQMQADEAQHALDARESGAMELPQPVKALMSAAAKVMTTTAHYV